MKLSEFAKKMNMTVITGINDHDPEIESIYIGDLLSRVMSKAGEKDAWVTIHTSLNTIAVAVMANIPCIILPESITADPASIQRASRENIAILTSSMNAYEIAWRAHEILC